MPRIDPCRLLAFVARSIALVACEKGADQPVDGSADAAPADAALR